MESQYHSESAIDYDDGKPNAVGFANYPEGIDWKDKRTIQGVREELWDRSDSLPLTSAPSEKGRGLWDRGDPLPLTPVAVRPQVRKEEDERHEPGEIR
jgi:hypothetical protein